jgi:F0F1-type ATP synthase assembly protein I
MGSWVGPAASLLGIGWFFATAILLGVLLGYWLDQITGLEPLFIILGIILGLAVAGVGGFRMLQQFLRQMEKTTPPKGTR